MTKTRRNDPCPCGSGKKFKRCCLTDNRSDNETLDSLLDRYYAHMNAEQFDQAEGIARELLRRFPERIDGDERLGEVYEARQRDLPRAAEHFRRAAERMTPQEPNYDPAYVPFILYRADQLERRARGVTPTRVEEIADSVAGDIIRGDLADVELGIADLLQLDPDHHLPHERRGQLCEVQRDFEAAARHFRLAADRAAVRGVDPAHVRYLRRRAAALDPSRDHER
jgi:tetratricopeptide (TPR) repeat protein